MYIVRHPCVQCASGKRLGWNPRPDRLLGNPRLVADHLHPFEGLIRSAESFWERAGAYWAATTYVVHRQTRADEGRIILAYEWLCGDPLQRFEDLYRRLGLSWSPRAERFIRRANSEGDDRAHSLNRPTARQIDKWKERLSPDEIQECRRFVDPFGLPYYQGFEPDVASPSGDRSADIVRTQ